MKYKRILNFFAIALICGIVVRTFQVVYTIDGSTGFFKSNYAEFGFKMMVFICALLVLIAVMGASVRRCPRKLLKVNPILGILSIALSVATVYEISTVVLSSRVPNWQVVLFNLSGYLAAAFFAAYGIKAFYDYRLPHPLYILPVIFWIIKLIYTFTAISTLSLITDNIFMLACYCAVLIFMLEFAKLANNIDMKWNFKKILSSGLSAVYLCFVFSVPRLLVAIFGNSTVLHESIGSAFSTLLMGAFTSCFLISHFKNRNLSKRKHSVHSTQFMKAVDNTNDFYIGE